MHYQYIDNSRSLEETVDRLRNAPLLGVDTEAAGYHRFHDRLSLLQISSREENFLIDPFTVGDLSPLSALFLDESVEKIFHDADFDLRILHRDATLEVHSLFDTQIAAALVGERLLGLAVLVEKYLGVSLPKAYQRADWAERPLTEGMREYAATDTAHLPALRDRLLEELERRGRVAWATEEYTRREATRWGAEADAGDAFLRLKGARDLTPRGLAILREVFLWRESVGKERDQATFRILPNQALLEIALKAPRTPQALREISGISPGMADRRGRDVIEAVNRGLAVEDGALPRFPPSKRWERDPSTEERAERLRRARNRVAEELDLDPGVVMSRAVLDEIARRNPQSLEELRTVADVRAWQTHAFGDQLLDALKR